MVNRLPGLVTILTRAGPPQAWLVITWAVPGCAARTGVPHGAAMSVPLRLGRNVLRSRATAGLIGRVTNGAGGRYVVAAAGRTSRADGPGGGGRRGAEAGAGNGQRREQGRRDRCHAEVAAHAHAEDVAGHLSGSSVIPEQEELT